VFVVVIKTCYAYSFTANAPQSDAYYHAAPPATPRYAAPHYHFNLPATHTHHIRTASSHAAITLPTACKAHAWLHGHQHIIPYHLTPAPSIPTLQHAPQPGYYYPYLPQTLHGAVDPGRQHEADVLN